MLLDKGSASLVTLKGKTSRLRFEAPKVTANGSRRLLIYTGGLKVDVQLARNTPSVQAAEEGECDDPHCHDAHR